MIIFFFPRKLISVLLWNQHYLRFFLGELVLFGVFVLFEFVGFFLDLCSLFLEPQKLHPAIEAILGSGKQTGKGILWHGYREVAFHKLVLKKFSHLKVNSCIICVKI